jgi:hypothetical protein
VVTRYVIRNNYSVVEVRRVGLDFVIYSGSVCALCVLRLSVDAEFLIHNDISISNVLIGVGNLKLVGQLN